MDHLSSDFSPRQFGISRVPDVVPCKPSAYHLPAKIASVLNNHTRNQPFIPIPLIRCELDEKADRDYPWTVNRPRGTRDRGTCRTPRARRRKCFSRRKTRRGHRAPRKRGNLIPAHFLATHAMLHASGIASDIAGKKALA